MAAPRKTQVGDILAETIGAVHPTNEAMMASERMPEATQWRPPSTLEAPEPRPGFAQKWAYVGYGGEANAQSSLSSTLREGWRPRSADSVSDGFSFGSTGDTRFAGAIIQGDLCLMEMPNKVHAQMKKYYDDITRRRERSVGTALDKLEASGPLEITQELDTEVKTGVGAHG